MSYIYEWVKTISTLCERKECASLDEAFELATFHLDSGEYYPVKIMKDDKKLYGPLEIREEIKLRTEE